MARFLCLLLCGLCSVLTLFSQEKSEVSPVIEGESDICAGGGFFVYRINNAPEHATFQWYVDGVSQLHEEDSLFRHVASYDVNTTTVLSCRVIYPRYDHYPLGFDKLVKDTIFLEHYVRNMECCKDPKGRPVARRLVWQEDFIDYELAPSDSQWVVPYLTDEVELDTLYDHTYDAAEGSAMFVAYREADSDTVLFSQVIKGLCSEYHHSFTAQCYVRTVAETDGLLKVFFRLIDLASGDTVVGNRLSNPMVSNWDWVTLSGQIDLTSDSLKLEIVTTSSYLKKMVEVRFVFDDLQIWMCVPHAPYLEVSRLDDQLVGGGASSSGGNDDSPLTFSNDGVNGKLWTVSANGSAIQYSLTPDGSSGWTTLHDTSVMEDLLRQEGRLYFRNVIGPAQLMSLDDLDTEGLCSPFSVSNVVEFVQGNRSVTTVSKPQVGDVLVCEGAALSFLKLPITVYKPLYYKWYADSLGTEFLGTSVQAPRQIGEGEQVSIHDYYVSMANEETGEESELAKMQVFIFAKPQGVPSELLEVCDSLVTLQGATRPSAIEGCSFLTEIYEDAKATVLSDGQALSNGESYIQQRLLVFDQAYSCKGNVQHVTVDLDCMNPHVQLAVDDAMATFRMEMSAGKHYLLSLYSDKELRNVLRLDTLVAQEGASLFDYRVAVADGDYYYRVDVMEGSNLLYRTVGSFSKGNPTGLDHADISMDCSLSVGKGELRVKVLPEGALTVTDLMGRVIFSCMVKPGDEPIVRLKGGVYLVNLNGRVSKVIVP